MKIIDSHASRRRFLVLAGSTVAAMPLAGLLGARPAGAADAEKLSLDDPTAKTLGYVHDSTVDGQSCRNCNFWQGGEADWGGCPLFPGKNVSIKGWCRSWVKKA